MKATELRIGNIVFSKISGGLITVQYIPIDIDMDNYGAVKLTEEMLLKFGFNKDYQKGYIGIDVCNSDFVLTEPLKMGEWQKSYAFQFETGNVPKFKQIEYVHQLQNLYFALSGEELEIKS